MNAQLEGSARSRHKPGEMNGIGPIDPELALVTPELVERAFGLLAGVYHEQ